MQYKDNELIVFSISTLIQATSFQIVLICSPSIAKPKLTSQQAIAIRPATWSRSRWPLDVIFLPLAQKNKVVVNTP
jgi:hypothetical protein